MHTATSVFGLLLGCDEDQNKENFPAQIRSTNDYVLEMTVDGAQE
jgi:hypothetical protein